MPRNSDAYNAKVEGWIAPLKQMRRNELRRVFKDLPPAPVSSTEGEYEAHLLDQGDLVGGLLTKVLFRSKGPWVGKAFRPRSEQSGEGYNLFVDGERRTTKLPMDTYVGDSAVALGQSMILDYRRQNRGVIRFLIGELRQYNDHVLLGMGAFGPRAHQYYRYRRVIPFVLVATGHPYQFVAAA